ncbi:MAG TPA: HepT-like ribonuclease domain-containing protein [Thermoanaerobaculia bacterium]|nr:HepT-like ribonuclease domain-containing protein [Thermoanaerobaculia bacterium]
MDRDLGFLVDILIAARDLVEFKQGKTKEEFLGSKLLRSAILHQLVLIGEASRRLSDEFRAEHSEIPWQRVIALRNFVVHEYDEIDFTIVWTICERHVPELIAFCEPIAGGWVLRE